MNSWFKTGSSTFSCRLPGVRVGSTMNKHDVIRNGLPVCRQRFVHILSNTCGNCETYTCRECWSVRNTARPGYLIDIIVRNNLEKFGKRWTAWSSSRILDREDISTPPSMKIESPGVRTRYGSSCCSVSCFRIWSSKSGALDVRSYETKTILNSQIRRYWNTRWNLLRYAWTVMNHIYIGIILQGIFYSKWAATTVEDQKEMTRRFHGENQYSKIRKVASWPLDTWFWGGWLFVV